MRRKSRRWSEGIADLQAPKWELSGFRAFLAQILATFPTLFTLGIPSFWVIINADQIIVINDGTILEQGTHPQLVKLGGVYADLFRNQKLMREMEIIL